MTNSGPLCFAIVTFKFLLQVAAAGEKGCSAEALQKAIWAWFNLICPTWCSGHHWFDTSSPLPSFCSSPFLEACGVEGPRMTTLLTALTAVYAWKVTPCKFECHLSLGKGSASGAETMVYTHCLRTLPSSWFATQGLICFSKCKYVLQSQVTTSKQYYGDYLLYQIGRQAGSLITPANQWCSRWEERHFSSHKWKRQLEVVYFARCVSRVSWLFHAQFYHRMGALPEVMRTGKAPSYAQVWLIYLKQVSNTLKFSIPDCTSESYFSYQVVVFWPWSGKDLHAGPILAKDLGMFLPDFWTGYSPATQPRLLSAQASCEVQRNLAGTKNTQAGAGEIHCLESLPISGQWLFVRSWIAHIAREGVVWSFCLPWPPTVDMRTVLYQVYMYIERLPDLVTAKRTSTTVSSTTTACLSRHWRRICYGWARVKLRKIYENLQVE